MNSPPRVCCPYCPGLSRRYVQPRGLNVHISRVHRDVASRNRDELDPSTQSDSVPNANTDPAPQTSQVRLGFNDLPSLKAKVRVLRHIPKGARFMAAGKLCTIIDDCLHTNSAEDWFKLLSFSYSALRVPDTTGSKPLTSKVKCNIDSTNLYLPEDIHDGDLRGAVRLLLSDSSLAPTNENTLRALNDKHPAPSRSVNLPPEPNLSSLFLTVTAMDVSNAIASFYNGSAAGLDGLRPQHLKELISSPAGNNGPRLLESLTKLCNFLLKGLLNLDVKPFLYGASLCALSKKDGGIRPIAVGSVFRRLTAKLCCRSVKEAMSSYLQPNQLGFGTALGCEAAIHSAICHKTRDIRLYYA
ncbi:hypothetical protein ABMA27_010526 [Loxostege sticticalis]|uniref:Reverse transcriptase domain-containing protein n=1 Tax=Loxostege sticticalis TaxID=481309 RepID=A0ABR3H6A2_LOXSC